MMKAIKNFMNKQWTWGNYFKLRTHRRHCGMGEVEGAQGTEENSESKSGRVRILKRFALCLFYF